MIMRACANLAHTIDDRVPRRNNPIFYSETDRTIRAPWRIMISRMEALELDYSPKTLCSRGAGK